MNRVVCRLPWLLSGLVFTAGFVYLLTIGNGRTYAFDEWRWISERQSWSVDALFSPHNGNLHPIPVAVYLAVFKLIGLDHPEVFRLLVLFVHVGNVACVGLLVRRRHGPLPGTVAVTVVMFLGVGAQNIIWGFQIGMAGSVLFFLLAVLSLDLWHERGRSILRLAGAGFLVLSVLSSSVGVCAVAGLVMYVGVSPRRRMLWWVPLPALACYALWYVLFQESVPVTATPASLATWVWNMSAHTLAAFFVAPFVVGAAVLLCGLAASSWGLVRRRVEPRMLTWLAFLGSFFVMTGLARNFGGLFGTEPPSRYLHISMIAAVLLVSDLVPRSGGAERTRPRVRLLVGVGSLVACLLYVVVQVPKFVEHDASMRRFQFAGAQMRGLLAIVEELPREVAGDILIAWHLDSTLIDAKGYRAAVARFGDSPAYPFAGLPTAPATIRRGADDMINRANVVGVVGVNQADCTSWSALTGSVDLVGGQSLVVKSPASNGLIVRRFFVDDWSVSTWREIPAGLVRIDAPRDGSDLPWKVYFSAAVRVALCP